MRQFRTRPIGMKRAHRKRSKGKAMDSVEIPVAPGVNLESVQVPPEYLERIPLRFARDHAVVAISKSDDSGETIYRLAAGNPDRHWVTDRIAYRLDSPVEVVPADAKDVLALISRAYHADAKEVKTI